MWDFFFNSRKILARERHPWIDYARGICIILVSYRHFFSGMLNDELQQSDYPVLSYINIFFFSFRMPLFFIVSGIFFRVSMGRKGVGNYVKNRFQTIFYPLLVWGILHITLQLLFSDYVHAAREPIDYLRLIYYPRAVDQFWYLNALFFVSVAYTLVSVYAKFNTAKQLVLSIILYAVAGYLHVKEIEAGFITDVFFFYFFFAVGDGVAEFMLNTDNFKKIASYKTLFLILPVFVLIQHYFTYLNLSSNNDYYVQNYQPALFALAALLGGSFVIVVSFLLQKTNKARFLRVVGYHSLYIYVANLIVTAATRTVLVKVFKIDNIPLLLIIGTTMGVVVPIMLYNVLQRMGFWWLFTLKKPEKDKNKGEGTRPNSSPLRSGMERQARSGQSSKQFT